MISLQEMGMPPLPAEHPRRLTWLERHAAELLFISVFVIAGAIATGIDVLIMRVWP